ncbi:hypothetical protein CRUP_000380, partial [Coryphaenoides rupestris]
MNLTMITTETISTADCLSTTAVWCRQHGPSSLSSDPGWWSRPYAGPSPPSRSEPPLLPPPLPPPPPPTLPRPECSTAGPLCRLLSV